jgi:hypothetical protein
MNHCLCTQISIPKEAISLNQQTWWKTPIPPEGPCLLCTILATLGKTKEHIFFYYSFLYSVKIIQGVEKNDTGFLIGRSLGRHANFSRIFFFNELRKPRY